MVDFDVYRTAGARALAAEPLYRAEDGHYQFKYLPAFAMVMAPFARIDREAAQAIWFALSTGLLTAFVRWSVRGLPERRRSEPVLAGLAVLFMRRRSASIDDGEVRGVKSAESTGVKRSRSTGVERPRSTGVRRSRSTDSLQPFFAGLQTSVLDQDVLQSARLSYFMRL